MNDDARRSVTVRQWSGEHAFFSVKLCSRKWWTWSDLRVAFVRVGQWRECFSMWLVRLSGAVQAGPSTPNGQRMFTSLRPLTLPFRLCFF